MNKGESVSYLPPDGYVLCSDGEIRKVQGTFKLTNDGAIACEEGECFCLYRHSEEEDWKVSACRRSGNPEDYGCWWQVDDCEDQCHVHSVWSTRELANAEVAKLHPTWG